MTFDKLCKVFMMQDPFYGIILASLQRVPCKASFCDTLCVTKVGDSFRLYYNPDFISQFNDDTVLQLLRHEVLHLCLEHLYISMDKGFYKDEQQARKFNIACDLEVNCYLDRSKMQAEVGGMWCEDFGYDRKLGALAYFKLLENDPNFQSQSQGGSGEGSKGSGRYRIVINNKEKSSFDAHDQWPKEMTEAEKELIKADIESLITYAAEETEKAHGTIPGEMKILLDKIKINKPKPVTDWKRFCRRYMGNEYTYFTKKSRKRESNRFPDAAGTRHQRKSRILVAIDTSGSVSMPEYMEFMGQILTMKEKANFRILECDAEIQKEYEFNGKIHTELHGCGGTDFQPVVDYYIKHRNEFDCLVYFTDGYCDIPSNTPKDTLWVISSNGDHDRSKYRVNGASSVFIPRKEA